MECFFSESVTGNKTYISNLIHTTRFWKNLHYVCSQIYEIVRVFIVFIT